MLSPVIFNGGGCLHVCLGTTCLSDAGGGQKGTSDPLELKLQTIVTWHPRARKKRWVLWKISQDPPFTFFYNSSMYIHIWGSLETPHNCSQKSPQRLPLMFTVDMTMCFLPFASTALFLDFCVIIDGSVHETGTPKEQHPHLTMTTETTTGQTEKNQWS